MAAKTEKKRKHDSGDAPEQVPFDQAVDLGMESNDEDEGEGSDSDDEQLDEFPEIDASSGSEEENFSGMEQSSENEEAEEQSISSDANSELHIFPESKTIVSQITGRPKRVYPEIEPDYDSDSSTEDVRLFAYVSYGFFLPSLQAPNRVGNVPMHWYDDLPHVGYDANGKQILRPARGDELDKFLSTVEDPSSW